MLSGLFPNFRPNYAPNTPTREESAAALIKRERERLDQYRALPAPSTDERIARSMSVIGGGTAGRVWYLPYLDSTTADTPEVRAAMRLMRTDPYVKSGWEPQVLTVESEDWQIQPSEAGNPDAEEQADFVKRMLEDYTQGGMSACVRAICAPLGSDGHSVAEKVWAVARHGALRGHIVLAKLPARDTDPYSGEVRLEGDRYGNVTHVVPLRTYGSDDGTPEAYSINDFVYSKYLGVFSEPLGEAAYRPVYGAYWMRDTVRKLRVIHCEKKMAGMLLGTYADVAHKPALDSALSRARTATWMSIPEGARVEAINLSTASEPDYKSFDESLREEIVQGLAFATLQTLQGTVTDARGSSAQQKAMSDLGPWLLMKIVTEAFNKQVIPYAIDYNFAYPAAGGYPKLTFGAVSNPELMELAQLVKMGMDIGLKPSRKYYAGALSIQEADPNDPDDQLQQPGMGSGLGGPPQPPAPPALPPGGAAGLPFDDAGLAPEQPQFETFGEGGDAGRLPVIPAWDTAAFFSERSPVHFFAWVQAKSRGKSGVKAVWQGDGTKRPLYGERARRALARAAKADTTPELRLPKPPKPPKPPAADTTPELDLPPEPAPTPAKGPTAARVAAGAKAGVKRTATAAKKVVAGTIGLTSRLSMGIAEAVRRIGMGLQKWQFLERKTGLGSMLATAGRRKLDQARENLELVQEGRVRSALKRSVAGAAKNFLAIQWAPNRRKYGVIGATVLEAAFLALKFGPVSGLVGAAGAALGGAGAGIAAAAAAAYATEKVLGFVVGPLSRAAAGFLIEKPFLRRGRGKKGLNRPDRRADYIERRRRGVKERREYAPVFRQWKRAAKQARRAGRPVPARPLAPWEQRELDVAIQNNYPLPVFPVFPERTSTVSPFAEPAPAGDVVQAARELVEGAFAAEGEAAPDLSDEWYAEYVAEALDMAGRALTDRAEAFREVLRDRVHKFGWTAGRTRVRTVKAVGTGPDAGKTLYGKAAQNALAKQAGVGPRKRADQIVEYEAGNQPPYNGEPGPPQRTRVRLTAATARELAVQSALADADGDPTAPRAFKALRSVKGTGARAARKGVEAALAGDEKALVQQGRDALDALAGGLPAPPPPATPAERGRIRGMLESAAAGMSRGEKKELYGALDKAIGAASILTAGDAVADGLTRGASGFANWLKGKPAGFVGRAVGALARLSVAALRTLGPATGRALRSVLGGTVALGRAAGRLALGAAGRVAGEIAESAGELLSFVGRPLGRALGFAGRVLGGAAITGLGVALTGALWAAPALAARFGLIALTSPVMWATLGLGLATVPLAVWGVRKSKQLGKDFIMRRGAFGPPEQPQPPMQLFADGGLSLRFGPPVSGSWYTFAWADWQPTNGGKSMKSPGGRVLSRAKFDQLSKGAVPKAELPADPVAARVADPKAAVAPAVPSPAPEPGRVYAVKPDDIRVDPERFQFKLNTNKSTGVGKELDEVALYDPELAGVLAVWRDPADGGTYVVNGHHRLDLAKRAGAPVVDVRYLSAKTAEEARAKGALINIAEGRGTAIDAAKFLRDTGRSAEDLAAVGVSLKGAVARDAVPLSKLSPTLFRKVTFGALDPARAIAVASHLPNGRDQEQLLDAIEKREKSSGRSVANGVVEMMAKEFRDSPRKGGTTETLFGALEDDDSTYFARAELKNYIRNELAKEAKDFKLGSSQRRADVLGTLGNKLDTAANATAADKAELALATFDGRATLKGDLSDLLNTLAVEYSGANPATRSKLRGAALKRVRALLSGGQLEPVERVGGGGPGLF